MIFLGLGSNLPSIFGDRFKNIDLAMTFLEANRVKIVKKSSFYETPSYPDKYKPKFINIVIMIKTHLSPIKLMSIIHLIEKKLERKRKKKNDPRTCDIDIIDFNKKILKLKYNSRNFIIPHKKAITRNFIFIPLKEIYPTWKHPKTNEKIDILIDNLKQEEKNDILKVTKN